MEPVDEGDLEHDVHDVGGERDHERSPRVREAGQVAVARERDEERRHADRSDPQVLDGVDVHAPMGMAAEHFGHERSDQLDQSCRDKADEAGQ